MPEIFCQIVRKFDWQRICKTVKKTALNMSKKKHKKDSMNGNPEDTKQETYKNQEGEQSPSEEQENEAKSDKDSGEKTEDKQEQTAQDELQKKQEEYQQMYDKYLRLYSEFDNFRRRSRKEITEAKEKGRSEMVLAILPVLDDFERALNSIKESTESGEVYEGVELIFNKFKNILHEQGLQEMEPVGQEFDPDYHEAMTKMKASSEEDKGKVVDEVQKGYLLNDRIVRHAKVVVGE